MEAKSFGKGRRLSVLAVPGVSDYAWPVGLVAVPVAELLYLTFAFDTPVSLRLTIGLGPHYWLGPSISASRRHDHDGDALPRREAVSACDSNRSFARGRFTSSLARSARPGTAFLHLGECHCPRWRLLISPSPGRMESGLVSRGSCDSGHLESGGVSSPHVARGGKSAPTQHLLGNRCRSDRLGRRLLAQELWKPLARYTFNVVAWTLSFIYPTTISDPSRLVIGTPTFR